MFQRALAATTAAVLLLTACSSGDDDVTSGSSADADAVPPVVAGEPFPAERCAANEAAGTITFLTGFDYAAAASIVEVINAEALGYYDEMCLDVDVVSSFSTANYPLVAGGQAQFASGGSFSEVVAYSTASDADLVTVTVAGRTPIDALIVKPGVASELADLEGATIGVKEKLPSSVEIMLSRAGLVDGENYQTVLLDGFDPTAHIALESIAGFPGWKSNEPGQLERAGIPFDLFDPSEYDVPGSFGAIFTTRAFVEEHPSAAEDFVRATLRGLSAAIADPAAAAAEAVALIEAGGNPNFLSLDGEVFRWETEAELIASTTPDGQAPGVPDAAVLGTELDAYGEVGLFGEAATPDAGDNIAPVAESVVADDGTAIWPG